MSAATLPAFGIVVVLGALYAYVNLEPTAAPGEQAQVKNGVNSRYYVSPGDVITDKSVPGRFLTGAEGRSAGPSSVPNEALWKDIPASQITDFARSWAARDGDLGYSNFRYEYRNDRPSHRRAVGAGPLLNPRAKGRTAQSVQ